MLALAPDASSQKAAQGVASPAKWQVRGVSEQVLFGECKGSGAKPYQACVDLSEPAYRCSCPSRKIPCKHVLGLLLLWSADGVQEAAPPVWVTEWTVQRAERAAKAAAKLEAARAKAGQEAAQKAGREASGTEGDAEGDAGSAGAAGGPSTSGSGGAEGARRARVAAGLADLELWLADQVRHGLAGADAAEWEGLAKRLVDAQAPGVAGLVGRLPWVRGEAEWPGRLLAEYSLLHLLAVAYRRLEELPPELAQTVMQRVGFTVGREEVLSGPPVRDEWDVLGMRDEPQERLTTRRVWLRGRRTGRAALVLSFAPPGQPLDASLVTGTTVDADLVFYPGAAPLRALVAVRHGVRPLDREPPGLTVEEALAEVASAVAADPWTESWPLVLAGVVPRRAAVGGLPLHHRHRDPWRLLAVSGGHPVTVAAEWTPQGLRPLTTWDEEGQTVIL
ncbi:SWIM zinc finger family protein [Thermoactinospora rubra]|uniref:SWIM zinc finger family protein n=1 Tax=Thermoactinospora rubra TaxID=1088767 RepID=UPI001F0AE02C|nr:SWIM zinc finger family protein [Thermoactinospora rubra]